MIIANPISLDFYYQHEYKDFRTNEILKVDAYDPYDNTLRVGNKYYAIDWTSFISVADYNLLFSDAMIAYRLSRIKYIILWFTRAKYSTDTKTTYGIAVKT